MKYLLNHAEEQIFLDNNNLIRELLSVLGAGAIIGLLAGHAFSIGWIIVAAWTMTVLFVGFVILWMVLHEQAHHRPPILMDTVPPENSSADPDKPTPMVRKDPD